MLLFLRQYKWTQTFLHSVYQWNFQYIYKWVVLLHLWRSYPHWGNSHYKHLKGFQSVFVFPNITLKLVEKIMVNGSPVQTSPDPLNPGLHSHLNSLVSSTKRQKALGSQFISGLPDSHGFVHSSLLDCKKKFFIPWSRWKLQYLRQLDHLCWYLVDMKCRKSAVALVDRNLSCIQYNCSAYCWGKYQVNKLVSNILQ